MTIQTVMKPALYGRGKIVDYVATARDALIVSVDGLKDSRVLIMDGEDLNEVRARLDAIARAVETLFNAIADDVQSCVPMAIHPVQVDLSDAIHELNIPTPIDLELRHYNNPPAKIGPHEND